MIDDDENDNGNDKDDSKLPGLVPESVKATITKPNHAI